MLRGNFKYQDYGAFLVKSLTEIKEINKNLNNVVIYCDNAKFHHVPALAELYSKVNILFSVRYSPIEELFGNWKYYFRRRKNTLFKGIGFDDIVEASMKISKRLCLGFISTP